MFALPGDAPVTITEAAQRHIAALLAREGAHALRIGIKKGGCAGMEYTMETVAQADAHDALVEAGAARVLIAPMAQMFLFGTEIDYETSLLESGFRFRNPNVAESCGCGESIKFKDVEELSAEQGQ